MGVVEVLGQLAELGITQVEVAEAINEKFGITDPVHRRYNVLAWVRGYFQDRGENHGHRYEALKQAQIRLSEILESRGIG